MINRKVLSTAAAIALLVPMVSAVQAQERGGMGAKAGGGGAAIGGGGGFRAGGGGGGGGFRAGGGGGMGMGGGGVRAAAPGAPSMGAASGFRQAPTTAFRGSPGVGAPVVSGGGDRNRFAGGGGGRGYYGGGYRHHHRGGGFWPGIAVGVGVGSTYGYYDNSPSYYDDSYGYYDDSAVAAAPPSDDEAVAYCMQRYRSYDPASGTYLGNDGLRHACPAQ